MMTEHWPWLMLAGLGAFHGLNPAMGWLFAVALGMHRKSRAAVFAALPPIALGHALSIAMVAAGVLTAGLLLDTRTLHIMSAVVLIGWALYHYVYGRRHRVRVGMQASQAGLVLWSFLMATAHGAGVMILPALIPLCVSPSPAGGFIASNSLGMAFAGIAVHTAAMLVVIGAVATVVFEWVGLSILRSGWINLDLIWTAALAATGVLQLLLA